MSEQQTKEEKNRGKTVKEYIEEKKKLMKNTDKNLWELGELASNVEKHYNKDSFGKWCDAEPRIELSTGLRWRAVYRLGERIKKFVDEYFEELKNKLSFEHFSTVLGVAKEDLERAIELLKEAVENNWTVKELREAIRGEIVKSLDRLRTELQDMPIEDIKTIVKVLDTLTEDLDKYEIEEISKLVKKVKSLSEDIAYILINYLKGGETQ
jgi:hypothetical protein